MSPEASLPPTPSTSTTNTTQPGTISAPTVSASQTTASAADGWPRAAWEAYLTARILHHFHAGVLYHAGITDRIRAELRAQNNELWWDWATLVSPVYEGDADGFVRYTLGRAGLWREQRKKRRRLLQQKQKQQQSSSSSSSSSSGSKGEDDRPRYDRYSDVETVTLGLWRSQWTNLEQIAEEVKGRYPGTRWFGSEESAVRVERFLRECGEI